MLIKLLKYSISFFLLITIISDIKSQEKIVIRDIEMWNSFTVSKELSKKWDIGLTEELRFIENASKLDILFTELTLDYKIHKRESLFHRVC